MIDLNNGTIIFDDGSKLSRLEEKTTIDKNFNLEYTGDDRFFRLDEKKLSSLQWGASLILEENLLKQIYMLCYDAEEVEDKPWDLPNEIIRKKFHDNFVEELCKGKGKNESDEYTVVFCFSWGRISSFLDRKSISAVVIIHYFDFEN